ncbi:Histone-lysine N-methyltransferase SETMAR-like [Oopsacas minuta]|uniref:Histone-lysine N-methyltransferase SETMAR-like n=1 Tax=Oopsacas minuta TaxID=111878 RepID=A0AAV7JR08_9METZ|nr:Histone-lysine N-methyltransferase SETMAR-like [Oopsacas minuta]
MEEILLLDWLPVKTTINSENYIEELTELRKAIKRERRGKLIHGVLLQHDNAMPHVSSKIMDTIHDLGFECLPPIYSPALAPSDYWSFREMERPLRAKRFDYFKRLEKEVKH